MRDARVGDFRKSVVSKRDEWSAKLQEFSYDEVPGLGSGVVDLQCPLILLTGPNGVGKSTLAKCLFAALTSNAKIGSGDPRIAEGHLKVRGALNGEDFEVSLDLSEAPEDKEPNLPAIEIDYLDCARSVFGCQQILGAFEDVAEITNGISAVDLSAQELAEVSRIVCREYRFVKLYEVEADGTWPYFEVAYGSTVYNSATMGDGELAALFIWWHFWRAKENALIILEEPESFLSAMCQKNLGEYVLSQIVKKKLLVVISTHSPNLIEVAPAEAIRFFARTDSGVNWVEGEPPPVLLRSIGITLQRRGHVFVEDTAAKAFTRAILERFYPSLSRSLGISVSGGEGEIRTDLKRFNALELDMKSAGVFDGDIAGDTLPEGCAQLPGPQPIEVMFRDCARANIERLKEISGVPTIDVILHALEGKDHHDWLEEFARELGLDKGQAFNLLFRVWIELSENRKLAENAAQKIAQLFP